MDMDGARELSKLIEETDALIKGFSRKEPFSKRVFAAHSESDSTANIAGIEDLQKVSDPNKFKFFRILKEKVVSHASLVLKPGPEAQFISISLLFPKIVCLPNFLESRISLIIHLC